MQNGITRGVAAPEGGVMPAVTTLPACEPKKHGGKHDGDDDDDDRGDGNGHHDRDD